MHQNIIVILLKKTHAATFCQQAHSLIESYVVATGIGKTIIVVFLPDPIMVRGWILKYTV
jgi:hypothetical protein